MMMVMMMMIFGKASNRYDGYDDDEAQGYDGDDEDFGDGIWGGF